MVLASELLDLIDASYVSFTEIGEVKGLIKQGIFENEKELSDLLSFLSSQVFPHEAFDGMFEGLAERGYSEKQYEIIFDLGLAEYRSEIKDHSHPGESEDWDDFRWIELTPRGRKILAQIQNSSNIR